jgi:hypothetical protein
MPNPGTGPFDGDGPTQFKAKLDRSEAYILAALWRKQNLLDKGMKLNEAAATVPLFQPRSDGKGIMFLHQFVQAYTQKNPGKTTEDAINLWRNEAMGGR